MSGTCAQARTGRGERGPRHGAGAGRRRRPGGDRGGRRGHLRHGPAHHRDDRRATRPWSWATRSPATSASSAPAWTRHGWASASRPDVLLHLRPLPPLSGGPARPVPDAPLDWQPRQRRLREVRGDPPRNLHEVHESVGELAGSLYEPLACVANCLCDPAVVSPGDSVLVVGPGAMGVLTCQVLAARAPTSCCRAPLVMPPAWSWPVRWASGRSTRPTRRPARPAPATTARSTAPAPPPALPLGASGDAQGRSVCAGRRDRQVHRVRDGPGVPQGARGHVH